MNKNEIAGLVEWLRERAQKIRGYIASSQMVVDYLAPEMEKFENRETPWDTYTVRVSADHQSSIRQQSKEAGEYEEAADALTTLSARVETLEDPLEWYADQLCEGWCDGDPKACAAIGRENCAGCPARQALGGDNG